MPRFEIIDHTADVGLVSYGDRWEDVFVNAAFGMFSLITDPEKVDDSHQREISVEADDRSELLVAWLNELLYLVDAESLIFGRFEITRLDDNKLTAIAYGEPIDSSRHELKTQVKAATYHQLKLKNKDDGLSAQVILDL